MSWGEVLLYFIWINKILSKYQIVDFSKPNAHECWALFLDLFAFYYPEFYHFTKCNFEKSSYLIKPGIFCNFLHQNMWLFIVIHFIYYHSLFKQVVCSMVTMLCTDLCKFHNVLQTSQNHVLKWTQALSSITASKSPWDLCLAPATAQGSQDLSMVACSETVSFMVKEYPIDCYCAFPFLSLEEDILIVFTLELLWLWQLWISFLCARNFSTLEYKLMNRI